MNTKQVDSGLLHSRLGAEPCWEIGALLIAKLQAAYCVPYVLLPVQLKSRWQNINFMQISQESRAQRQGPFLFIYFALNYV